MFGSVHACGVYICNEETSDFIPLTSEQFLRLKRGEKISEIARITEEYKVILEQEDIASLFDVPCQFPNPAGEFLRSHLYEITEKHNINVRERLHNVVSVP
jgi:hypothetical protein